MNESAVVRSRRATRQVSYGDVAVGGGAPISIQSMSTCPASSHERVMAEIVSLRRAGCEIVRVAVKEEGDIDGLARICGESPLPVIADIHFDCALAVRSAAAGAAGLRINPGNIGGRDGTGRVLEAAEKAGIPVRVGINAGSIEKDLRELHGREPAKALFESASRNRIMIEEMGFDRLVFSLKSSDPVTTIAANRLFAADNDYPMHIGVTESGTAVSGAARSAVALTLMLAEGIGDTVRISLSGDPVKEVAAAAAVLSALGLRTDIPRVIACPTCGRCWIDVAALAERVEEELLGIRSGIRVAIMGCEVNGPGEAREADIGLAGTRGGAVLFRKGEVACRLEGDFTEKFLEEVRSMALKN
jgi:(E)-4-hydroxy-3-methylbut-2-enyl-diphosphate synthase